MIIHVVADSDSRWKWGSALAGRLISDGHDDLSSTGDLGTRELGTGDLSSISDLSSTSDLGTGDLEYVGGLGDSDDDEVGGQVFGHLLTGRATPTEQQVYETGAGSYPVRRVSLAHLVVDEDLAAGDVVILALAGGAIQSALRGLARAWAGRTGRPVVLTGYVGLVYERMIDGLLLRAGADVVLANSAGDAERFAEVYAALGADPDSVVQSALPFLGGADHDAGAVARGERPFTVCFATQPTVPLRRDERRYALDRAAAHARRHPQRRVIVKLRSRPGDHTTHIERYHYARMYPRTALPGNLELRYGSMADALDETDLCVTVSSTAAMEALQRRIPTAVLSDFGIRESLGNHVFLGSKLFASWEQLDAGTVPTVDPNWLAANGVRDPEPYTLVRERVGKLVAERTWLPALQPWYDHDHAAGYVPALMVKYGLDEHGSPVAVQREGKGSRTLARRAAQRVLHFGVTRVAPPLRQWSGL